MYITITGARSRAGTSGANFQNVTGRRDLSQARCANHRSKKSGSSGGTGWCVVTFGKEAGVRGDDGDDGNAVEYPAPV